MTPKEKAQEIYNKIHDCGEMMYFEDVKKSALIAVDEILLFSQNLGKKLYQEVGTESYSSRCENANMASYFKDVKKELELL